MNDPHVEALIYSIEHAESYDYSDSAPVTAHLYQQIGQLKVERDFLSRKSGL